MMTQLEALKILCKVARQDGPDLQTLIEIGVKDEGLLAYARRRDQALVIVARMITRRTRKKGETTP